MVRDFVRRIARSASFQFARMRRKDIQAADWQTICAAWPHTMTSVERLIGLIDAVRYVVRAGIPGSIVECGVWRGGSMMAAALTLMHENDQSRDLFLYDTFQGMTPPTDRDLSFDGKSAAMQLASAKVGTGVWCHASLQDVEHNLQSTGYPAQRIRFVQGDIVQTIPATLPGPISILRLDTDWYESTRHELEHLYPLVSNQGIVIVDDYGHWQGSRKAVDEFIAVQRICPYLHRLDYTGRVFTKEGPGMAIPGPSQQ
jgi:hypothetical protein